jgi:hypothetical protein
MTRSPILTGALVALLLAPAALSVAAPRSGGMGASGMGSPMASPHMGSTATTGAAATSTTTHTTAAPTHTPVAAGQPNQSCQAAGSQTPGNAANASGSAFNPSGQAGTVYAGQQPQNSNNPASVSQYDVACTKGGR